MKATIRIKKLILVGSIFRKGHIIDFTHAGKTVPMICLAGVNGSGKSTILKTIHALMMTLKNHDSITELYLEKYDVPTDLKFIRLEVEVNFNSIGKVNSFIQYTADGSPPEQWYVPTEDFTPIDQLEKAMVIEKVKQESSLYSGRLDPYPSKKEISKWSSFLTRNPLTIDGTIYRNMYLIEKVLSLIQDIIPPYKFILKDNCWVDDIANFDIHNPTIDHRCKISEVGDGIFSIIKKYLQFETLANEFAVVMFDNYTDGIHTEYVTNLTSVMKKRIVETEGQLIVVSNSRGVWETIPYYKDGEVVDSILIDLTNTVL